MIEVGMGDKGAWRGEMGVQPPINLREVETPAGVLNVPRQHKTTLAHGAGGTSRGMVFREGKNLSLKEILERLRVLRSGWIGQRGEVFAFYETPSGDKKCSEWNREDHAQYAV
jgi:hypothetical protein